MSRMAGPGRADRQFVTALARGLDILSRFRTSREEIGGTELAALTGLPQPTVWRLCHTMAQRGFLVQVKGDKLRPGLPLLRLGRAALASIPLAEAARVPMQAMADRFGSASGLGAQDGDGAVMVQRCLSEAQLVMNLRVGVRLPMATSGIGWGLLAGFAPEEREAVIARHVATDPRWAAAEPAFRAALAEYKTLGVILNLGVFHKGYNTAAAPVLGADGRPRFALTCAGSATSHTRAVLRRQIAPVLRDLASALERQLRAEGSQC